VITTFAELNDVGMWTQFCEISGMNPWCVKEGLMSRDEPLYIDNSNQLYTYIIKYILICRQNNSN